MAGKLTGLGHGLWVDGVDLSGDAQRINSIRGGPGLWESPALNDTAMQRKGLTRVGHLDVTTFFNPDAGASHVTLDTLPRTARQVTYRMGGVAGVAAASLLGLQVNYDPVLSADGKLYCGVQVESDKYGLEWGILATGTTDGTRTDTAATNGTGLDYSASSAFGLQAYLHVFSFTGTSVTVKLQHSTDDAATDPYADITGGGFVAATAAGVQRIATTGALTIKRYIRVVTTGTFSSARFGVVVVRNAATPAF